MKEMLREEKSRTGKIIKFCDDSEQLRIDGNYKETLSFV